MNLSLFEEVGYTGELELPVVCKFAVQRLASGVHSLKLQLEYGARTTDAIIESWRIIGPNILLCPNPVKSGCLSPTAVHLQ